MTDADIIVVGAGPVGMLAALLSAQQGCSVLLLEQAAKRHIQSRAIGITPPSLEILSKRNEIMKLPLFSANPVPDTF